MINTKRIRMVQSSIGCAKRDCVKPAYTLMLMMIKTKSFKTVGEHNLSGTAARVEAKLVIHQMKMVFCVS